MYAYFQVTTNNTTTVSEISNTNRVQQNVTVGIDVPPNDLQIIIDKMASYVTKNGKQFEETARKRRKRFLLFINFLHFGNINTVLNL